MLALQISDAYPAFYPNVSLLQARQQVFFLNQYGDQVPKPMNLHVQFVVLMGSRQLHVYGVDESKSLLKRKRKDPINNVKITQPPLLWSASISTAMLKKVFWTNLHRRLQRGRGRQERRRTSSLTFWAIEKTISSDKEGLEGVHLL